MDLSDFAEIITAVKTPLAYLVLATLLLFSLAYYFFKEASQNIRAVIYIFIFLIFTGGSYIVFSGGVIGERHKVVLMDSSLKVNIYDKENREFGIINSQRLRDILERMSGLEADFIVEPTNFQWKGEENILNIDPDLIIIHYSAFERETIGHNDETAKEKFRSFLKYMKPSKSSFIIYTRGNHFVSVAGGDKERIVNETGLNGRLFFFKLDKPYTFRDAVTQRNFKAFVKEVLNIE